MNEPLGLVADTIAFSSVDGPGNRFVVFLQGCDFDCIACHNPQTIPDYREPGHEVLPPTVRWRSVGDLLAEVRRAAPFLSGITVSGGEATRQPEFLAALFAAVKADPELARLTCFVDSNGAAPPEVWAALAPFTDGAMIDLKCLDPAIHLRMTGRPNEPVLAGIRQLHALGLLHEVRLLLAAGLNDDEDLMRRTGEWLAALDPLPRVKLIGFRRHGTRAVARDLVEPTPGDLEVAAGRLLAVAPFELCVV